MMQQNDNADLDRLKALWNKDLERQSADPDLLNQEQLLEQMQQQVNTTLQQLRRNLRIDIFSALALLAGLYFLLQFMGRHIQPFWWLLFVLITVGYHCRLYFKLGKQLPTLDADLQSSVDENLRNLKPIIDMGRWSGWVLAGLLVFGGARLALKQSFQSETVQVGLLMLFAAAGAVFAARHYIESMYGKHYKRLMGIKDSFQE